MGGGCYNKKKNILKPQPPNLDSFTHYQPDINGIYKPKWIKRYNNDNTCTSLYWGEWKEDLMHGRGCLYFLQKQYSITGTMIDNVMCKKYVQIVFKSKNCYTGQVNQMYEAHGFGNFASQSLNYTGEFKDNKFDGKGYIKTKQYTFEGQWKEGRKLYGQLKEQSGVYVGNFFNDKFHGEGTYIWQNGGKYQGHFQNGQKHGLGTLYDKEGRLVRKGNFNQGSIVVQ